MVVQKKQRNTRHDRCWRHTNIRRQVMVPLVASAGAAFIDLSAASQRPRAHWLARRKTPSGVEAAMLDAHTPPPAAGGWATEEARAPWCSMLAGAALGLATSLQRKQSDKRKPAPARAAMARADAATARADGPSTVDVPTNIPWQHGNLPCTVRGVLPNGLRFVFLKHTVPPGRFEAHLEFHVGSIDESDKQQGMAHMLEHICFIGCQKRIALQSSGIGMTSNALTDFQHTVYHLNLDSSHLPAALEVLKEVGFAPEFRPERVEKERAAVLSEAQMVNSCTYRLQTQIIGAMHRENPIHRRFPIGMESQIASWSVQELRAFHSQWYVPENATLYLVGDLQEEEVVPEIHSAFAQVPHGSGFSDGMDPWETDPTSIFRPRMESRPSVLHNFIGPPRKAEDIALAALRDWTSDLEVSVATNDLVQGMQVCWAAKVPMLMVRSVEDLGPWLSRLVLVEVVRLRLQTHFGRNTQPCNFHAYDSYREGVAVITLTVMTEPARWSDSTQEVLQQVQAITQYGIDKDEMEMALRVALDRTKEAAQSQPWALMGTLFGYDIATTSREVIEALISSAPAGNLLTSAKEFCEGLCRAGDRLTTSDMSAAANQLLGHFGGVQAPAGVVAVTCPPALVEEHSHRRIDFAVPEVTEVKKVLTSVQELSEEEVRSRQVAVPASLLPKGGLMEPVEREELHGGVSVLRLRNGMRVRLLVRPGTPEEPAQGTLRVSAPGGRWGDCQEGCYGAAEAGLLTLESCGVGKWSPEQIQLYQRVHSVAPVLQPTADLAQVDVHFPPSLTSCRAALEWIHWLLQEPKMQLPGFAEAQLRMKGNANASEKSMEKKAVQALLQELYPSDQWLREATLDQVNRLTLSQVRKAVEAQFGDPGSLEVDIFLSAAPHGALGGGSSGLSHAEDVDGSEICAEGAQSVPEQAIDELRAAVEQEVCRTLGTVLASPDVAAGPGAALGRPSPRMAACGCERRVHILDADERALALIAGGAPGYWGEGDATWQAATSSRGASWGRASGSPLYPAKAMELMNECLNNRLLGRVRDQLSLTYHCECNLTMYEGFPAGHFVCKVFSFPDRLPQATAASLEVLQSPGRIAFMDREVEAAKQAMVERERRARRERGYWVSRLQPLAGSTSIRPEEELRVLERLTADDVQSAWRMLTGLEDPFVVLATSGGPHLQSMLPQGQVVPRSPQLAASAAEAGDMDFLD